MYGIIWFHIEGGAADGTLTIMVGCSNENNFDKFKPLLSLMGKNIVNCGGIGID